MSETSSADTLTDLGIYSINLRQDHAEALQYFRRAIKLDSTYADAYLIKFLERRADSPKAETVRELINGVQ